MNVITKKPDSQDFHEINYGDEFSLNTYTQKVLFENLNYLGKLNKNVIFSTNFLKEEVSSLIIDISGRLAQEFVKHGILNDKDFILELVKIISNIHAEEKIEISVNPLNYSLMKTILPELNKSIKNNQDLDIICDENITINNFKIECGDFIMEEDLLGKIRKLTNILKFTNKCDSSQEVIRYDNEELIKKRIKDLKYISGFELLNDIDSQTVANIIQNEHPQTISLILKKLNKEKTEEILSKIPEDIRKEITDRIKNSHKLPNNVLDELENNIYRLFGKEMFEKFTLSNGIEYVTNLLQLLEPEQKKNLLEGLGEYNPSLAKKITG